MTHPDRITLHPTLLRSISDTTRAGQAHERVGALREVVHLAEKRHQERSLARASGADDEVDLPAAEEHFVIDGEHECAPLRAARSCNRALGRVRSPGEGRVPDADAILVRLGNGRGKEGSLRSRLGVFINKLGLKRYKFSNEIGGREERTKIIHEIAETVESNVGLDESRDDVERSADIDTQHVKH